MRENTINSKKLSNHEYCIYCKYEGFGCFRCEKKDKLIIKEGVEVIHKCNNFCNTFKEEKDEVK